MIPSLLCAGITYHRIYMPDVIEQQLFPLDRTLFPIGKEYGQEGAVVQHNNWVFGADEKRQRQREHGLYLFNSSATEAAVQHWVEAQQARGVNTTGLRFTIGVKDAEQPTAASPAPSTVREWPVDGALLQCEACPACDSRQPAQLPLRITWPGRSVLRMYQPGDGYRGLSTSHP